MQQWKKKSKTTILLAAERLGKCYFEDCFNSITDFTPIDKKFSSQQHFVFTMS